MRYLILFLFCVLHSVLFSQNTAYNPIKSKGKLYEYAEFAKASNSNLSINDILNGESNLDFNPLTSENQSLGFTSDNYWLNFKLENTTNQAQTYYLQTARPITDIANLYQISNNNYIEYNSGDAIAFNDRQVQHRKTVFKLELPKNSVQKFYIHLKSDGETLNLPLLIQTENEFWKSNYNEHLFLGFFYGLLFLAAIVYLFFFTSLSNKTFLYYSIYVLSIALLQSALDGIIFQYILPSGGYLNNRTVLITALFSNFFLLKYCERFLKVSQRAKHISIAFKVLYITIIILGVLLFVNEKTKEFVYPISNVNGLLSLILILVTLFYLRYKSYKIDVFFSVGIFFLVIGLLGFVMNNLSLLPNNFITLNSAKFGITFEVIFLSLSMSNLIRDLRLEKEKSQIIALNKSEEISELKSYFMSNISHELRTPINAIMGIADDELSKNPKGEMLKNFEVIKHASLNLLSNINDILDFEKIEKGELKLRTEHFNPKTAVIQISDNWKRMAEKKDLKYSFEIDSTVPEVLEGDPERFTQIINNVLSNAVKFTHFGKIDCNIKSTTLENNIAEIAIIIKDTGIGIKDSQINNLFNSFGQMRLNDKRSFGGVGLGLSITKHLIDLFKGSIEIDSEENRGTSVTVSLPLKVIQQNKIEVENPDISKAEIKVLVVEDNTMNQLIMKKILKTLSINNFQIASNGVEAIKLLENNTFDVILMDLQMPEMDGYETTTIIRNDITMHSIKNIPIIAVTADATDTAREKVIDVGMNDYITKPVNRDLLYRKILTHRKNELKIA
ncbi:hybrid sensor histidine kinase/response regulator [Lacinutrix sp. 5H-3-7-4]|uniref:hybrid sensor histidine kinase/response regulator n=1 Tax=Lacinutrix sp. (strain 5H-3-7-4) TaxID=983544 RepID=UPI00020A3662|nr:hybrid sensor histidine kinase/response regulator [Lacinutrix sp. 5H-3-7-4]AEH00790.1 response regulator receiver [Lacinutrix sp. 5H-3-7-4]